MWGKPEDHPDWVEAAVGTGHNNKDGKGNNTEGYMLPGTIIRPTLWAKIQAWFHNNMPSGEDGGGNEGSREGGICFIKSGDPISTTTLKAEHDVDQVNIDLILLAFSYATTGGRPTGWNSLTPAEMAQRVKDITEISIEMTSDKEILNESAGNNNEILIASTYEKAWLDNTTIFDEDGDSVVRNEGDTAYTKKTFLNKATGKTREERELYKKPK